ncbi:hypothetical protein AOLI_G00320620 [Acnodon oligacanthus]
MHDYLMPWHTSCHFSTSPLTSKPPQTSITKTPVPLNRCCLQIQARDSVHMTLLTEVLKLAKAFPVEMTGPNDGGMIVPHSLCSLTSAPPGAASDTSFPYLPGDVPLPQTTVL